MQCHITTLQHNDIVSFCISQSTMNRVINNFLPKQKSIFNQCRIFRRKRWRSLGSSKSGQAPKFLIEYFRFQCFPQTTISYTRVRCLQVLSRHLPVICRISDLLQGSYECNAIWGGFPWPIQLAECKYDEGMMTRPTCPISLQSWPNSATPW